MDSTEELREYVSSLTGGIKRLEIYDRLTNGHDVVRDVEHDDEWIRLICTEPDDMFMSYSLWVDDPTLETEDVSLYIEINMPNEKADEIRLSLPIGTDAYGVVYVSATGGGYLTVSDFSDGNSLEGLEYLQEILTRIKKLADEWQHASE